MLRVAPFIAGSFLIIALSAAAAVADEWPTCNAARGDEAIAACSRLIAFGFLTGRNLAMAYDSRGHARQAKGDLDGAISDFDEAIRLAPSFYGGYFNRGEARRAKGDREGAIAGLAVTKNLSPRTPAAVVCGKAKVILMLPSLTSML